METRDQVIREIRKLEMGSKNAEDYIIEFKALAPLTNYRDIPLIQEFK